MPPAARQDRPDSAVPTDAEVDAQLSKLCDHELLQGEKRSDLLKYLVRIQREGRYNEPFGREKPRPTGKTILYEFYVDWAKRNGEPIPQSDNRTEAQGKKLIGQLKAALKKYYKNSQDRVGIQISRGRDKAYAPKIEYRQRLRKTVLKNLPSAQPHAESSLGALVKCEHLGNEREALRHILERYRSVRSQKPKLVAVRDTHTRPERRVPHHEKYEGLEDTLHEFLKRFDRESTVVTLILGVEVDREYLRTLRGAASGQEQKLKCFRLRKPGHLMNFLLFDYDDESSEVIFGWGLRKPGWAGAVFRSKDRRLVEEFNNLYEVLLQSSDPVSIQALLHPSPPTDHHELELMDLHPTWNGNRFEKLIDNVIRGAESAETEKYGDLCICTTLFINELGLGLRSKLIEALGRGVRIKILLLNPLNRSLVDARFRLLHMERYKGHYKPERVLQDFKQQIKWLKDLRDRIPADASHRGSIEVRVSDVVPMGFAAHSPAWAVVGFMHVTETYRKGPMIEALGPGAGLWKNVDADWRARWEDSDPVPKSLWGE